MIVGLLVGSNEAFLDFCSRRLENVSGFTVLTALGFEEGSGLGLSIVNSIVDFHGWNVKLNQEDGNPFF